VCGDHVIDAGELCDDGNMVEGDGCNAACQLERAPSMCPPGTIAVLKNEGFETGVLAPWAMNNPPTVTLTDDAHSGAWAAEIDGNNNISQTFAPVPVTMLDTVDLWTWHTPNGGGMAVYLIYSDDSLYFYDTDEQEELDGWRHFDFLQDLGPRQSLVALVVFGHGSEDSGNTTRFDDLRICRKP
jgi:cysteine-rich repeat protein